MSRILFDFFNNLGPSEDFWPGGALPPPTPAKQAVAFKTIENDTPTLSLSLPSGSGTVADDYRGTTATDYSGALADDYKGTLR